MFRGLGSRWPAFRISNSWPRFKNYRIQLLQPRKAQKLSNKSLSMAMLQGPSLKLAPCGRTPEFPLSTTGLRYPNLWKISVIWIWQSQGSRRKMNQNVLKNKVQNNRRNQLDSTKPKITSTIPSRHRSLRNHPGARSNSDAMKKHGIRVNLKQRAFHK